MDWFMYYTLEGFNEFLYNILYTMFVVSISSYSNIKCVAAHMVSLY